MNPEQIAVLALTIYSLELVSKTRGDGSHAVPEQACPPTGMLREEPAPRFLR